MIKTAKNSYLRLLSSLLLAFCLSLSLAAADKRPSKRPNKRNREAVAYTPEERVVRIELWIQKRKKQKQAPKEEDAAQQIRYEVRQRTANERIRGYSGHFISQELQQVVNSWQGKFGLQRTDPEIIRQKVELVKQRNLELLLSGTQFSAPEGEEEKKIGFYTFKKDFSSGNVYLVCFVWSNPKGYYWVYDAMGKLIDDRNFFLNILITPSPQGIFSKLAGNQSSNTGIIFNQSQIGT